MTDRETLARRRATKATIRGLVSDIREAFIAATERYRRRWEFVLPPEVPFE